MAITARILPKFPARVVGGTGVDITKTNGVYTIAFDLDPALLAISDIATDDGNFIVGTGAAWVAESGSTARDSLGLGSIATQAAAAVDIEGGTIDATVIGGTTPAAGTFTTIAGTTITGTTSTLTSASETLGAAAGAGSQHTLVVRKTGIANNSATGIITVTVPNAAHNASIFLDILGHLGTGTDASESSRCATGSIVLARTSGADTVVATSTLEAAQIATVSGGGTLTLAYGVSAISGASNATQTFNITLTLVVTGTITDHTAVVSARLLNSLATGVTMAAA